MEGVHEGQEILSLGAVELGGAIEWHRLHQARIDEWLNGSFVLGSLMELQMGQSLSVGGEGEKWRET